MSISSAPPSTARRTSSSFTSSGECPLGNAVATLATFTLDPASARFATGTRFGYTQTAAHGGTSGERVRTHRLLAQLRTLPGVSLPSSVVRSIIEMAS